MAEEVEEGNKSTVRQNTIDGELCGRADQQSAGKCVGQAKENREAAAGELRAAVPVLLLDHVQSQEASSTAR
jgi:hypothetical protein